MRTRNKPLLLGGGGDNYLSRFLIVILGISLLITCKDPDDNDTTAYVAVTSITGVPTAGIKQIPLTLTGTVNPSNATNKTIIWSVESAGETGAIISGSTLNTTNAGTVTVKATIKNGKTKTTDFTENFVISITSTGTEFIPVTSITDVPTIGIVNVPLTLTGTVNPSNANNKTIVWSIEDAGETGATIEGSTLNTTSTGEVTILATVANGIAQGTNYTEDFTITINEEDPDFIAVTNISGVISSASIYSPNTLSGTVHPSDAEYQTIVWSVKNAGTTGARIEGNTLSVSAAGTVIVTATIANGTAIGTNYTQDFYITVSASFTPVTNITGVPNRAYAGTPLTLYGTVSPANASIQDITWTVKDAGYLGGVNIEGNIMTTTYSGNVEITATIANAISAGEDYVKDFTITVYAAFVPVTSISGVVLTGKVTYPYNLSGTVNPSNATNKTIIWSVKNAGTTGANISGSNLNFTGAGIATITATVASGLSPFDGIVQGDPYEEDFIINVDPAFVPVTSITGVPTTAYVGRPLTLTGIVIPDNANNKTINWSIESGTGATLTTVGGNRILNTTTAGTVVVKATINNGLAQGTPFTRDFPINVFATLPVINLSIENFNLIDEGEGVFENVEPIVLSKEEKDSQTITVIDLDDVVWYLGNNNLGGGDSITLNSANFNNGSYMISITFTKNGKSWLSRIPFTVTE